MARYESQINPSEMLWSRISSVDQSPQTRLGTNPDASNSLAKKSMGLSPVAEAQDP